MGCLSLRLHPNFTIKNEPYWVITPHYNQPNPTDYKIIDGWTVTKSDGSVFKYGDFGGTQNSGRFVHCGRIVNGTDIVIGPDIVPPIRNLYYEMDLDEANDVNGGSIKFKYQQYIRQSEGFYDENYVGESYVNKIISDRDDTVFFDLNNKNAAEGYSISFPLNFYNLTETKYLSRIRIKNKNNILDTLVLTYDNTSPGVNGREKRFLRTITSKMGSGILNHIFEYDLLYKGYLNKVLNPMQGKGYYYTYKTQVSDNKFASIVLSKLALCSSTADRGNLETIYTYSTDVAKHYYDTINGIAYWGTVTQNSRTGNVVTEFDINNEGQSFGMQKQIDLYNTNNKLISSTKYDYTSFAYGPTESRWYLAKLIKTEKMRDGVTEIGGIPSICGYNTVNGLPKFTYAINSNGTALAVKQTYAFEQVSAMGSGVGNKNMLTQIADIKSYKIPNYNYTCDLTSAIIVNANTRPCP